VIALLSYFLSIPPVITWIVFGTVMVLTGIPHGAADYVVYLAEGSREPVSERRRRFFSVYLLMMAAYALLWWLFPVLCLLLFIGISAYHFGQSQLYYIRLEEHHWLKIIIYLLWGSLVLLAMLYFNRAETAAVVSTLPGITAGDLVIPGNFLPYLLSGGLLIFAGLALYLNRTNRLSGYFCLVELLTLAALCLVFHSATLLLSFAVYFGGWHSWQAMMLEWRQLNIHSDRRPFIRFLRMTWAYNLISLAGIALILLLGWHFQQYIEPLMVFFIVISVLTMPHMYFVDRLYQKYSGA
jgi:beta-carotene 15,15'-dioxygenase